MGAGGLRTSEAGALVLDTASGPLEQAPPLTWVETATGGRRVVPCRYVIHGAGTGPFVLNIPGDSRLPGVTFYNQFLIDSGANTLGVMATNAVQATVRW